VALIDYLLSTNLIVAFAELQRHQKQTLHCLTMARRPIISALVIARVQVRSVPQNLASTLME